MKYFSVFVLLILLCLLPQIAGAIDLGNVDSTGKVQFPLLTLDTLGRDVGNADSLHVIVWHEDDAVHTPHLTRRTIVDDSTWQDSIVYAGDTTPYFVDDVDDLIRLDATPTPDTMYTGHYHGLVESYFQGKGVGTPFDFEVTRAGVTDVHLIARGSDADTGIVAIKTKLTTIAADVVNVDGGSTPWNATTMDSVLQALDYTNNTHEVVRQVVSTVANVTDVGTVNLVNTLGSGAIDGSTFAADAFTSAMLSGSAAREIADTLLNRDTAGTIFDNTWAFGHAVMTLSSFDPATDSVLVDGSVLAGLTGAISSTTMGGSSIGSSEIGTGAIDADALAGDAAREIADSMHNRATNAILWAAGSFANRGSVDSVVIDAVRDTIVAHAPHGNNWASAGAIDLDAATGTLSDAQIDEITVNVKAEDTVTVVNNVLNIASTDTLTTILGNVNGSVGSVTAKAGYSLTDAAYGVAADSVAKHSANASLPDTTIGGAIREMHDSLETQGWAATGAGAAGTGPLDDTTWAIDTSGTDTAIPGVQITARNASGTLLGNITTNGTGYEMLKLPQSTAVTYEGFKVGYVWNSRTLTSESGTTDTDSLFGYDMAIPSATTAGYKIVYGREYVGGDSLAGAVSGVIVTATLVVRQDQFYNMQFADTLNDNSLGHRVVAVDTTNSTGFWQLSVPMNTIIVVEGATAADSTFWQFTGVKGGPKRFDKWVYLNSTTSEKLIDLTGKR